MKKNENVLRAIFIMVAVASIPFLIGGMMVVSSYGKPIPESASNIETTVQVESSAEPTTIAETEAPATEEHTETAEVVEIPAVVESLQVAVAKYSVPEETAEKTAGSSAAESTDPESEIETAEIETEVSESTVEETAPPETESSSTYLGNYYVTGYCTGSCCNGSNANKTASGAPLSAWETIAMKGIDFGTRIYIDGLGEFVVQDRGVGHGQVDLCVNSHDEAYSITGHYDVYIVE